MKEELSGGIIWKRGTLRTWSDSRGDKKEGRAESPKRREG